MNPLRGRVVVPGHRRGTALVSHRPLNVLATFYDGLLSGSAEVHGGDADDPEIFGQVLTGTILCIPRTAGSTSAGATWHLIAELGIAPAAVLLSDPVDSLTAAGVALAAEWTANPIVTVDRIGPKLLEAVASGDVLEVHGDGRVEVVARSSSER